MSKLGALPMGRPNSAMLMFGGKPALMRLAMRESTTAPGRIKYVLATRVGDHGETGVIGDHDHEFRMEMS